ncbi:hypothetical protein PIB30_094118, partial [Stylosanthes scabra]|nr:hypothetical protein [Stylosanthes scabra]
MGDFIEEKLEKHPILWCDLNKTIEASILEAKPEKLIEGKALQDGVLNATTPMSTHSKENALVSSEGLKYVPPPLRQATKRGRNSPWMRDKKGKKDKGKLDEPGKKKSVKTNGVAENVSYMEWNLSTNLSELKGQPLEFYHDHSYKKGVYAYLVKDTSKWKMVCKGMAPAKTSTSTAPGSTVGNPNQPLNYTYFDTKCQNNARKLATRSLLCEHSLKFPEAIQEEFQLIPQTQLRRIEHPDLISIIHLSLHRGLCFSLSSTVVHHF